MKDKILLIGGGGHCKSCIDVIEEEDRFEIAGVVDNRLAPGSKVANYPVLGSDGQICDFLNMTKNCLITVGQIKSPSVRIELARMLAQHGALFPCIISPLAHVAKTSKIGCGSIVMHHALINSESTVGEHVIINSKSLVEHDSHVASYTHLSTGAILNGGVTVRQGCFIGSGAVIYNGIDITDDVIIPAGSVVRTSINEPGIFRGKY